MAENGRQKRHDVLVLALAAGQAVRNAAASAGVSERTAFRRLADPDFRRQVHEARAALVQQAVGKLTAGMAEAEAINDFVSHRTRIALPLAFVSPCVGRAILVARRSSGPGAHLHSAAPPAVAGSPPPPDRGSNTSACS